MNAIISKKAKNEAMPYDTLLCGVCSHDNKIALTLNKVKVCYDCLKFNRRRAKGNGLTEMQQLEIDTKYISLNAT